MKRTYYITLLISLLCFNASTFAQKTLIDYFLPAEPIAPLVSNGTWGDNAVLPRDIKNGLEDSDMSNWCYWDGSIVKDDAGKYHMYASRWDQKNHHHVGWTQESKGTHAVSDNLYGPYIDQGETWHNWNNGKGHNVIGLRMHDGRYAMVSSEITQGDVFVSDTPNGPFEHLGEIQVDYSGYHPGLAHYTDAAQRMANVMIFIRPDGRYMLMGRNCAPMISEAGILGPYRMLGAQAWVGIDGVPQSEMEDPTIWYSDGLYHIVVNHHAEDHSYHLTSLDGVHNWKNRGLAIARGSGVFRYTNGVVNNWYTIQRPTVYTEDEQVKCFNFSVIDVHKGSDGGNDKHGSKIIVVPFDGENFGKDMRAITAQEEALVDATPLPAPWKFTDVGAVNSAGKSGYDTDGEVFKISASGADIGGTQDAFGFAYQKLSGDMTVIAQVMMQDHTDPWAKSGVMIRENLNANAKYAAMMLTPENGAVFQTRTNAGGTTNTENLWGVRIPYWVRLVKKGNVITASISASNMNNFETVKEITLNVGSEYYIGVAVSSHSSAALNTTRFRKVNVYSPNYKAIDDILSHNMPNVVPASGKVSVEVEYMANGERDIIVSLRDITNWVGMGDAKATVSGMGKVTINYQASKAIEDGVRYQWEINMRPKGASWQNSLFETQGIWAYKANSLVIADGISLSPQSLSLDAGQSKVVTATLSPANVTDKSIRWSSDNSFVAQVDINGKVTALSSGTATITAKSISGKVQKTVNVTVSGANLVDAIPSHTLPAEISPAGSANFKVDYVATTNRDIYVELQANKNGSWVSIGQLKQSVVEGIGSVSMNFKSTETLSALNTYRWNIYMTEKDKSKDFTIANTNISKSVSVIDKSILIPGVIEAEKFTNTGGLISDNVAGLGVLRETNAISYVNEGDWVEYDINVTEDGMYGITYSISSYKNGAQIQFLLDGKVISTDDVNNNGSWNAWYDLEASNSATLYKGLHTLRIKGVGANNDFQWNLDKITLVKASDIPTGLNNHEEVNVTLSPNPFDNTLQIVGDTQIASLKMTSINGVSLISTVVNATSIQLNTSDLTSGIYLVQLIFDNGEQSVKKVIKL